MISNQILQTTLEGLKNITRIELCITDTDGKVLAGTFPGAEEYEASALAFADSPADSQVVGGCQFFKEMCIRDRSCSTLSENLFSRNAGYYAL